MTDRGEMRRHKERGEKKQRIEREREELREGGEREEETGRRRRWGDGEHWHA